MWRDRSRQHNAVIRMWPCTSFYSSLFSEIEMFASLLKHNFHFNCTWIHQSSSVLYFKGIWVVNSEQKTWIFEPRGKVQLKFECFCSLLLKPVIEQQIQRHFLRIWKHGRKHYSSKTFKLISRYRSIFTCTRPKYYNTSGVYLFALLLRFVIPFDLCLISCVRRDTGQTFGHLCSDHSETVSHPHLTVYYHLCLCWKHSWL